MKNDNKPFRDCTGHCSHDGSTCRHDCKPLGRCSREHEALSENYPGYPRDRERCNASMYSQYGRTFCQNEASQPSGRCGVHDWYRRSERELKRDRAKEEREAKIKAREHVSTKTNK